MPVNWKQPDPSPSGERKSWHEAGWYECLIGEGASNPDGVRQWGNHPPKGLEWKRSIKTTVDRRFAADGRTVEAEHVAHLVEIDYQAVGTADLLPVAIQNFGWVEGVARVGWLLVVWLVELGVDAFGAMLGWGVLGLVAGWVLWAGYERNAPELGAQARSVCHALPFVYLLLKGLGKARRDWRPRADSDEWRGRQPLHAD